MLSFWRTAIRPVYLPIVDKAEDAFNSFAASGRALFYFFAVMLIVSAGALLFMLNSSLLIVTPAAGGTLTEGILGTQRFINPVLAATDADHDLSILVYSGLLKTTPSGDYEADLASDYQITDEGRPYTFTLREGLTFHDGTPVTAHDVVFTAAKDKDASIKSPLRANWE